MYYLATICKELREGVQRKEIERKRNNEEEKAKRLKKKDWKTMKKNEEERMKNEWWRAEWRRTEWRRTEWRKETKEEQNEEQIMTNILKVFTYRNKDFILNQNIDRIEITYEVNRRSFTFDSYPDPVLVSVIRISYSVSYILYPVSVIRYPECEMKIKLIQKERPKYWNILLFCTHNL